MKKLERQRAEVIKKVKANSEKRAIHLFQEIFLI